MRQTASTIGWTIVCVIALLWPARLIGPLDGAPLDGRLEALLIGVGVPVLWWLDRAFLGRWSARGVIVALLAWKLLLGGVAVQEGLCARVQSTEPLNGIVQQMPIEEPSGVLRSWDLRADWRAANPECTAILTRPLPSVTAFPAWFVNITDHLLGHRDVLMTVRGYFTTSEPTTLDIAFGDDMYVAGFVNTTPIDGEPLPLPAGKYELNLSMELTGDQWRFEPMLSGLPLWDAALVTTDTPTGWNRATAAWGWIVSPLLLLVLVAAWIVHFVRSTRPSLAVLAAAAGLSLLAVALALQPMTALHRTAGLLSFAALLVPVATRTRNLRGAFLLVGLPWLAFFAAWSIGQVGHVTAYSADDWLSYQLAGYRIFMHGYWLEGGTAAFDYQPLYRWMTGALHMVFGDSSVGEVYWDAACLLMGALLAFQIVRATAGFRWGILAASATLAAFTLGTPWYFFGRGLSETAAAGWAFLAMFFILRGRLGGYRWIAAGAVMAVLMFYTRLNHLLFAAFLPALLLSLRTPATWSRATRAVARLRRVPPALYAAGFTAGVLLFMLRTWYYTGVFSLFYGTSLRHNDTGLRPWTLFDLDAWSKVAHSLAALVFLNEPPSPDPRALFVIVGALVLVAALLQVPVARRVPAALVLVAAGACVGSFFAHTHHYPGRSSIHLVPLVTALAVAGMAELVRQLQGHGRHAVAPMESRARV